MDKVLDIAASVWRFIFLWVISPALTGAGGAAGILIWAWALGFPDNPGLILLCFTLGPVSVLVVVLLWMKIELWWIRRQIASLEDTSHG